MTMYAYCFLTMEMANTPRGMGSRREAGNLIRTFIPGKHGIHFVSLKGND